MDKEHVRILITILVTAAIFAIQAIVENAKKRRAIMRTTPKKRTSPKQTTVKTDSQSLSSRFGKIIYEPVDKSSAMSLTSQKIDQKEAEETPATEYIDEIQSHKRAAAEDLRRAVIWSEILTRKY